MLKQLPVLGGNPDERPCNFYLQRSSKLSSFIERGVESRSLGKRLATTTQGQTIFLRGFKQTWGVLEYCMGSGNKKPQALHKFEQLLEIPIPESKSFGTKPRAWASATSAKLLHGTPRCGPNKDYRRFALGPSGVPW